MAKNQGDSAPDWTILAALDWTREFFGRKGVENPRLDAELLLARVLGLERIQLYVQFERVLTEAERAEYRALVRRRGAREPVTRLLGEARFMGLSFEVNAHVMAPRPETELLVEWLLDRAAADPERPILAADLCSGTGAIAVAAAAANPLIEFVGVDISGPAVDTARRNAELHGVGDRVRFLAGDLAAPLEAQGLLGGFDLVLSNPPYIPSAEIDSLMPEVRDHEPRSALDGGPDGLDFYRRLASEAAALMKPGAGFAVEIGAGQAEAVLALFGAAGFVDLGAAPDLAGIPRMITGVHARA